MLWKSVWLQGLRCVPGCVLGVLIASSLGPYKYLSSKHLSFPTARCLTLGQCRFACHL